MRLFNQGLVIMVNETEEWNTLEIKTCSGNQ